VSAVVLVDTVFYTALTPLLPHYVHRLGLSKASAGLLVAAYPIGTFLGALPGGVLATRLGVRPAVLFGLALMSVSTLVFGLSGSPHVLEISRFVQGLGGACSWAGGLAWLAAAASPERRGSALGVAIGGAIIGAMLGPLVGTLASAVGTAPAFAAAAVFGGCLMVACLLLRKPLGGTPQPLRSAFPALLEPRLAGGLWLTGLVGMAFGVVDVLAPLRLNSLGARSALIGGTFFCSAAIEAGASQWAGRVADRRGRRAPVRVSLAAAVVVSALAPLARPVWVLVALLVVGLAAFGTVFVPAAAMVSDGADGRNLHLGLAFGLSNLAWAAGQGIAAASSGAIAEATSDLVPYFVVAACFAVTLVAVGRTGRAMAPAGAET
jgi:MFS family permease